MKAYDPKFHNNIVSNVRAMAKQDGIETLGLSDEQIYDVWAECYYCEDVDKETLITLRALVDSNAKRPTTKQYIFKYTMLNGNIRELSRRCDSIDEAWQEATNMAISVGLLPSLKAIEIVNILTPPGMKFVAPQIA